MHTRERKEALGPPWASWTARKVLVIHERMAAQAARTSAGDMGNQSTPQKPALSHSLLYRAHYSHDSAAFSVSPSAASTYTHSPSFYCLLWRSKWQKKRDLTESIRCHPTWSLPTGHSPQTRSSHRLVGSVHLAYLDSCFGHKEGLGQPVRVW